MRLVTPASWRLLSCNSPLRAAANISFCQRFCVLDLVWFWFLIMSSLANFAQHRVVFILCSLKAVAMFLKSIWRFIWPLLAIFITMRCHLLEDFDFELPFASRQRRARLFHFPQILSRLSFSCLSANLSIISLISKV